MKGEQMTIDLQPFCSTWQSRPQIKRPFSRDGYTYATDGRVIVRVARRKRYKENPDAPDVSVCGTFAYRGITKKLPRPIPKTQKAICDSCGNDRRYRVSCDNCNGTGRVHKYVYVRVGSRFIDAKYLHLLAKLPNIRIQQAGHTNSPAYFSFDGGCGYIMPLQNPKSAPWQAGTRK